MSRAGLASVGILAIAGLLCFNILIMPTQASSQGQVVEGEVIVKLVNGSDLASVAQDFSLDPAPIDQFTSQPIFRLRILDGASPDTKAAQLLADRKRRVVYAEPNEIDQSPEGAARVTWSSGGDSGAYVTQWAPSVIRLYEAQNVTRGAGITVAVLDTGVDLTHPTLAGKLVAGYDFIDNDNDPSEVGVYGVNRGFGHGTHVAGLVALTAPEAKIMPVRVLDPEGAGDAWTLAKALAFAMDPDGNPATSDGANVINLSISMPDRSKLVRDVLKAVTCVDPLHMSANDLPCFLPDGSGAVVVSAAGNSGSSTPEYPAGDNLAGSVSVGASTQLDQVASFSNYGSWVMVAAPGENILSTVPGGGFGTWSGTSMATPFVAGEAALVRAAYPQMSVAKVAQRIISKGVYFGSLIKVRIDVAAALGR
ncbi:MAG TPA: S8 family serine peptidase [Blastocatellia bacterium]|nr:S8 family serine peptidase [Blastocatellia bacterium]